MKKLTFILRKSLFVVLLATLDSCSESYNFLDPSVKPHTDSDMDICVHVADIAKKVDVYYAQSETLEEMSKYLDKIKNLQYVEDAYTSGNEMFVVIKDYGMISFYYNPDPAYNKIPEKELKSLMKNVRKKLQKNQITTHRNLQTKSIAIINQAQNDEGLQVAIEAKQLLDETRDMFEEYGFKVDPAVISPDVKFFNNGIFDYDVVFLQTHGGYNEKEKFHTFLTSEVVSNTSELDPQYAYPYKNIAYDKVYISEHKEVRNGREERIWYASVTEKWISDSKKNFTNQGNAIVFNGCCLSMRNINPDDENDTISYSVAEIFEEKGAAAYFGYDESNGVGHIAGCYFLHKLFSGMSIERAYEDLPFMLRHNKRSRYDSERNITETYWADLIPYPNLNSLNIGYYCLSPFFSIKHDFFVKDKEYIVLYAKSYYSNTDNQISDINKLLSDKIKPDDSPIRYGFFISENPALTDAREICKMGPDSDGFNQNENNGKYFSVSIEYPIETNHLKEQTKYYYWAYFFDGEEYYLSDMNTFTTHAISGGTIPDVPGSDF